jgi:hypothetical protein
LANVLAMSLVPWSKFRQIAMLRWADPGQRPQSIKFEMVKQAIRWLKQIPFRLRPIVSIGL